MLVVATAVAGRGSGMSHTFNGLRRKKRTCAKRTCVRDDLVPCQTLVNMMSAGTYTSVSKARTVERMNTLLDGLSIPCESSRATQEGSSHEPLCPNKRHTRQCGWRIRTQRHISTIHKQSMGGSRGPSTEDRRYTTSELVGALLIPSSVVGPHSRQTSAASLGLCIW